MILTKTKIDSVDLDLLANQKISSNKIEELLIIVPTNRKARNLKKQIISLMPLRSAAGLNIETIGTVSSKLLNESKPFKILSEAAATVFIKQSASEVKLKYFSIYKNEIPFGTLDRIKNVISEYKKQGITPETLRIEVKKLDKSEKLKALDIANIYDVYYSKCYKLNAYEIGDVYKNLNELKANEFENNFRKLYLNVDLTVVNGFDEFTYPEIEILNRLSDVKEQKLFINFDYNEKNKFIFSHLDKCYARLEEFGFSRVKDSSPVELNQFREILRDQLFKVKRLSRKHDYTQKIFEMFALNREKEIELIAREIKQLIAERNVEPHNICVVFNLIQDYSSIVRDIFQKNGLPLNLTDRISLDNSNPVTAVVNFLEIAENDFYFKNIFRALSSGFLDTEGIDFANLYRVSSELKIVSGKRNWISTLSDELSNLKYTSDDDEEEIKLRNSAYSRALKDIQFIEELLKPFENKLTISEFQEKLFDFIYKSKLPFKLLGVQWNQEENVRGFTKFIDTVTEIFDLLEEEYGKSVKFGIAFFMDQIRTACSWARFNVKEKSNYGVQVTTLEEIRGLKFDYLFIGGLCDGDFPTRYKPEIFYSGSFKKQAFTHQTEERNRFYQALSTWEKGLYLCYPQTHGGKETVVSTFLNDFVKLFDIFSRSEEDYSDILFSQEEAEIYIGKNVTEDFEKKFSLQNEFKIDLSRIQKAIEVTKMRETTPSSENIFNGILSAVNKEPFDSLSPKALEILNSYSTRQYSISQLETYAKCPFKFFVERVLGIETIEEPTEDIEAIEMGRILHTVLFEFYTKIRDENISLADCDEKTFEKVRRIIFEIAEEQITHTLFKSPLSFYEREKIFGIGGNPNESLLNKFLEYERSSKKDYLPKYFEASFGSLKREWADEILSDGEPIKIDGIKLRGKIDRIEVSKENDSFNIVDYKLSGTKPTFQQLKDGIALQLPVYLFAAGELLNKKFCKYFSPNEMFIYSLKYTLKDFGKLAVSVGRGKDEEIKTVEQLINRTINHIKKYINSIAEGKFGLSPHEDREKLVCRYCQFKSACRIQETAS